MSRFLVVLALLFVPLSAAAAAAPPPDVGVTSPQVTSLGVLPDSVGGALGMEVRGDRLFVVGRAGLAVYDTTDPAAPRLLGRTTSTARTFAHTLQVSPDGRLVLFRDVGGLTGSGKGLVVLDTSDPARIREVGRVPGFAEQPFCVLGCDWVYGSGGAVVDLRDPTRPKRVSVDWADAARLDSAFMHVVEVRPGLMLTSPSKGTFDDRILRFHALDVTDPLRPRRVTSGASTNDRYSFRFGQWPDQGRSSLVLQQELFNGEDLFCLSQGAIRSYAVVEGGELAPLHTYTVDTGVYADGSPAATPTLVCGGSRFDTHPSFGDRGLLASGHLAHGTRFVRVDAAGRFTEVGWHLPVGAMTTQATWASDAPEERVVYALDDTRGVYLLRWDGAL